MSYETWETANTIAILAVVLVPIVLALGVFLNRRQQRDADGKRTGRAVLWSFVTAFFSFLAFVVVWGLTLQEPFPEYAARWSAENEQQRADRMQAGLNLPEATNLCAEQYRRLDPSGWDQRFDIEHAVTSSMASSANENFREMSNLARDRGIRLYMVWIPRRGETIQLDSNGMGSSDPDRNNVCIMGIDRDRVWHNVSVGMLEVERGRERNAGDGLNACMLDCNRRFTNGEYVSDRFYSCAAACRAQWP